MIKEKRKGLSLTASVYLLAELACVLTFVFFPQKSVINKYMMKVTNEGLIYFIATLGLCVMLGMGGQVTFSTAGMMGIGAYSTAIATTRFGMATLPALLLSVVLGGLLSFVIGLALFRLKGSYFSFASDFINGAFSYRQLCYAMRLGKLGQQFVLKSKAAFEQLEFLGYETADSKEWYKKKAFRDQTARRQYFDVERNRRQRGDLYITTILDEEMKPNDPRLR